MKKIYQEELNKIVLRLRKLIKDIDEEYYKEYKSTRRKGYKVKDLKTGAIYKNISQASKFLKIDQRTIRKHPERYEIMD